MNRRKRILISIGIVVAIILIVIGANIMLNNSTIKQIELTINYPNKDTILNNNEIYSSISSMVSPKLLPKRKDLDTKLIKQKIKTNDFVDEVKVGITLTGILKIEVTQREPIVRVYTKQGKQYYIDNNMNIISTLQEKSANVIVANGDILDIPSLKIDSLKNKESYQIWKLSKMINDDSLLCYQIDQIYKEKNDYILIPKIGTYKILLGQEDDWKKELIKLHYLYKKAFVKYGWDNYTMINLKFNNQVVCTRKDDNN
jgi:cell division protein FtsQ